MVQGELRRDPQPREHIFGMEVRVGEKIVVGRFVESVDDATYARLTRRGVLPVGWRAWHMDEWDGREPVPHDRRGLIPVPRIYGRGGTLIDPVPLLEAALAGQETWVAVHELREYTGDVLLGLIESRTISLGAAYRAQVRLPPARETPGEDVPTLNRQIGAFGPQDMSDYRRVTRIVDDLRIMHLTNSFLASIPCPETTAYLAGERPLPCPVCETIHRYTRMIKATDEQTEHAAERPRRDRVGRP